MYPGHPPHGSHPMYPTYGQGPNVGAQISAVGATAIGFFMVFFKSPATAIKSGKINMPEGIVFAALYPLSLMLYLWASVRAMTAWMADMFGVSVSEIRNEMGEYLAWGSAFVQTILLVAVWFAILVVIPLVFFAINRSNKQADTGSFIPLLGAVSLPYSLTYVIMSLITLVSILAGFGFALFASVALTGVAFWVLYGLAIKRCFGVETEHAVYCSIIAYIVAGMFGVFIISRIMSALYAPLLDDLGMGFMEFLFEELLFGF